MEYIAADFDNVLDSDDDGLVNIDEIHALIHRPVFHGFGLEVGQVAVNSDTNRDGYLSLAGTTLVWRTMEKNFINFIWPVPLLCRYYSEKAYFVYLTVVLHCTHDTENVRYIDLL